MDEETFYYVPVLEPVKIRMKLHLPLLLKPEGNGKLSKRDHTEMWTKKSDHPEDHSR